MGRSKACHRASARLSMRSTSRRTRAISGSTRRGCQAGTGYRPWMLVVAGFLCSSSHRNEPSTGSGARRQRLRIESAARSIFFLPSCANPFRAFLHFPFIYVLRSSPALRSDECEIVEAFIVHRDVLTGLSDLDRCLAHRMLLLPWTQRICHQSWPQRDQLWSGGPHQKSCGKRNRMAVQGQLFK